MRRERRPHAWLLIPGRAAGCQALESGRMRQLGVGPLIQAAASSVGCGRATRGAACRPALLMHACSDQTCCLQHANACNMQAASKQCQRLRGMAAMAGEAAPMASGRRRQVGSLATSLQMVKCGVCPSPMPPRLSSCSVWHVAGKPSCCRRRRPPAGRRRSSVQDAFGPSAGISGTWGTPGL